MSDNVTITGTTIAADDLSGVQYQRVKVVWGADGVASDATVTAPLPTGQFIYDGANYQSRKTAGAIADGAPGTFFGSTALHVFNGTTYDRVRGDLTNGLDVDVTRVQGTVTTTVTGTTLVDSELPPAQALSDTLANPTAPSVGAHSLLYNGSTWSRKTDFVATDNATIQTGIQPVHLMVSDGATDATSRAVGAVADGNSGGQVPQVSNGLYNGSTVDRERGNTQGSLLASAARTSTTSSPIQTNYNARGLIVHFNVTTVPGGENLTPRLFYVDPVSGGSVSAWVGATVTTSGLSQYLFYPGSGFSSIVNVTGVSDAPSTYTETQTPTNPTGFSAVLPIPVPRTFFVQIQHSAAGSWTYSVGYSLIL